MNWVVSAIVLLTVVVIAALVYDTVTWLDFKSAHNCRVAEKRSGTTSVIPIINSSGGMSFGVNSTTSQTGWLCDDGVIYWR